MLCNIGVTEEERTREQEIIVHVTMYADLHKACICDRLEETINYSTVEKEIQALIARSSCALIECLAELIAQLCLNKPKTRKVKVTVEKPEALTYSASAGVTIVRSKH